MRKNGFMLNKEYWRRRHEMIMANKHFRKAYNSTIPRLLALVNINEITNKTIPKIIWRMQTFHNDLYKKLDSCPFKITSFLKIFNGYHVYGVQNKSNAAYVRKMTRR